MWRWKIARLKCWILRIWCRNGSPDIDDAEVDESDVTILMYTSGTTSLPKGVMLTYGDFTNYVVGTVEMADGTDRGTSLCAPRSITSLARPTS